jgi:Uma2 family endonuclease
MGDAAKRRMTVDEYIAFEEAARDRHEFLDGKIWAMSGGTDAHDALSTGIAAELRAALLGAPCSARGPNLRVKSLVTGLYTYADSLVICEPRFEDAKRTTLLNPRVVVEVLSESSEGYDRGDKFAHYRSIESVGDYVLVATTTRQVEVYTRGADAWELRVYREGAAIHLPSVNIRMPLDILYRGVDLDPPYVHAATATKA